MPTELSIPDALQLAMELQLTRHFEAAEEIYQRVLEAEPEHPDALHLLGLLERMRGQTERAAELIQRAVARLPEHADYWNNLGNVLFELDRFDEAEAAYRRVLELLPDRVDVYNNLGVLHRAQKRLKDSEAAYLRAIELAPDFGDAHHNLGNLYQSTGTHDRALLHFLRALVLKPGHVHSRRMLGISYSMLGRLDEAAAVYREWLAEEPDSPIARHHLAACTGEEVPERAADAYVEGLFDRFATSFDAKLAVLTYRAPQLIAEALGKWVPPARALRVLDAGCGTGLCGPLLAPHALHLEGVDLSSQMLVKAEARRVYDSLYKAELTQFLADHHASYDVIASADTLCYFGALAAVARAAHDALAAAGHFLFTLEAHENASEPYCLLPHGRYTHSRRYIEETLAAAGFRPPEIATAVLRQEAGRPVEGWLIYARRPA